MKVKIILTCFNRKNKTVSCVKSLFECNRDVDVSFIIVDDNSKDGTVEVIKSLGYNIEIIYGDGNLYWAGGMRKGIDVFLNSSEDVDYVMLVNDDVLFESNIISKLIDQSIKQNSSVIVGATKDDAGKFSYGAMRLNDKHCKDLYHHVLPDDKDLRADTFNCNCVLLPAYIVREIGNFDGVYVHSLADIDYGLMIKNKNYCMFSSDFYVGICHKNSNKGTWTDTSLSRMQRIIKKESVKGAPTKQWFYFLNKNFGFFRACFYSVTPFIKILIKR